MRNHQFPYQLARFESGIMPHLGFGARCAIADFTTSLSGLSTRCPIDVQHRCPISSQKQRQTSCRNRQMPQSLSRIVLHSNDAIVLQLVAIKASICLENFFLAISILSKLFYGCGICDSGNWANAPTFLSLAIAPRERTQPPAFKPSTRILRHPRITSDSTRF